LHYPVHGAAPWAGRPIFNNLTISGLPTGGHPYRSADGGMRWVASTDTKPPEAAHCAAPPWQAAPSADRREPRHRLKAPSRCPIGTSAMAPAMAQRSPPR